VRRHFEEQLGYAEAGLTGYLGNMLARFARLDSLYRIRAQDGRRIHEVAEMLVEGDVRLNATSFEREREVHRHIGDYTLFWTGVFPESVPRLRAASRDVFIDYVLQGKESYYIVSTFELGRHRDEAPLFRRLSEEFELWMEGLRGVRDKWEGFDG
jgi:hypothetical protein